MEIQISQQVSQQPSPSSPWMPWYLLVSFTHWAVCWRRHEDARKTSGVAAVLILALIGVPFGVVDFGSWLFFCLLFAVAGGIATSLKITERAGAEKRGKRSGWAMGRIDDPTLTDLENELMLFGGLLRDVKRAIAQLDLHNLDLAMIDLLDLHDQILAKKCDAKIAYDAYQEKKRAVCEDTDGADKEGSGELMRYLYCSTPVRNLRSGKPECPVSGKTGMSFSSWRREPPRSWIRGTQVFLITISFFSPYMLAGN